jgi:alpha-methylacyl-CoA racemase
MLLSDFGADVVRIDRVETVRAGYSKAAATDVLSRGRRSVGIDLKSSEGAELLLSLVEGADVLIEGFRPGVMERLGLGPGECLARNPRLIYGRMTGYGQDGPWSSYAGHDVNYIALSGVLWNIGRDGEAPVPPLNYVADFGGGGMLLALGVCAALAERATSGSGQVLDAAMVDGSALLNSFVYGMRAAGAWGSERTRNLLDTGTPFYETYETADGKWIAVGALEPKFFGNLIRRLEIDFDPAEQDDQTQWAALREQFTKVFASRTRDEWCDLLAGEEACFAPVLSPWEAPEHPQLSARSTFVTEYGVAQPAPAPRFGRTPASIAGPPPQAGQDTDDVLAVWGIPAPRLAELKASGAVA